MSRSERKKHREQKRRKEVNKGLDDLMALLVDIDPSIKGEADREKMRKGRQGKKTTTNTSATTATTALFGDSENPLMSRVDLISRTVIVLDRLNRENKQQRLLIQQLSSCGGVGALFPTSLPPTIWQNFQHLPSSSQVRNIPLMHSALFFFHCFASVYLSSSPATFIVRRLRLAIPTVFKAAMMMPHLPVDTTGVGHLRPPQSQQFPTTTSSAPCIGVGWHGGNVLGSSLAPSASTAAHHGSERLIQQQHTDDSIRLLLLSSGMANSRSHLGRNDAAGSNTTPLLGGSLAPSLQHGGVHVQQQIIQQQQQQQQQQLLLMTTMHESQQQQLLPGKVGVGGLSFGPQEPSYEGEDQRQLLLKQQQQNYYPLLSCPPAGKTSTTSTTAAVLPNTGTQQDHLSDIDDLFEEETASADECQW
jgi:hypothetical protein